MKTLLQQLAAYHTWANQKLADLISTLPDDVQQKEVVSSFLSLHLTLLHMWNSESVWWQRLKLQENINPPVNYFKGDTKEIIQHLSQQNKMWEDWVNNSSEMSLDHVFKYQNTKREPFKQPTYQMLLHVFNHGSYHRGQLVTMLRQLGFTKIPETDFIVWSRKQFRV
ncbi:MAG TPA: DinB family protein [Chitinophagaceae bacterium]|nr:DinB family protein [Chitinophagaceae bacterium]